MRFSSSIRTFAVTALVAASQLLGAHAQENKKPSAEPGWGQYAEVMLLNRNSDALKVKRRLIRGAEKTIDLSYFVIEDDPSSSAILLDLLERADKSIRIRVLVDYFTGQNQVPALLLLDRHPQIEVRRFRPPTEDLFPGLKKEGIRPEAFLLGLMAQDKDLLLGSLKDAPWFHAVADFRRTGGWNLGDVFQLLATLFGNIRDPELVRGIDRFLMRTHHKLLLVDGTRFVMGGRNMSDEYHVDLGDELLRTRSYPFQDTDVAAVETGGHRQQESFERLWNAPESVPITEHYLGQGGGLPEPMAVENLKARADQAHHLWQVPELSDEVFAAPAPLQGRLVENTVFEGSRRLEIAGAYADLIRSAKKRIDIVTAYFYVDGDFKDEALSRIQRELVDAGRRGVAVRVFTNSPESTDLRVVNRVAYRNYLALEREGIEILELGPGQGSLHTKAMAVDNDVLAIGSFNMDPRSHAYDTNNLLLLRDESGGLVKAFRAARVDGLRWQKPGPEKIERFLKEILNVPDALIDVFRRMI